MVSRGTRMRGVIGGVWIIAALALSGERGDLGAQERSAPPGSGGTEVGRSLFDGRRYAEARTHLTALARAEPRNAEAAYYLGRLALVDGNSQAAAKWLERAIAIDGRVAAYHRWLGRAYARSALRANRLRAMFLARDAKRHFETAVALDPDDVDARVDLFEYYLVAPGIVGGSTGRARAQAAEITRRNPYRGRIATALVAERAKDFATAARAYAAAIEQYPDSSAAYYALGDMDIKAGRYRDAFATFERLLRVRPDELGAYYWIGRIGSVSGQNLDRSAEALRTYLSHPPREGDAPLASAHYRLGMVYEKQGKRDLAGQEYESTIRLDPGQSDARDALRRVR